MKIGTARSGAARLILACEVRKKEAQMKAVRCVWGLLIIFVAAACNPGAASTPPPEIPCWWDQPLANSTYEDLSTIPLTFHCASLQGVEMMMVKVNGLTEVELAPSTTGSGGPEMGTLFLGEASWTPPAFGTYLLEVQARQAGGEYGPATAIQVSFQSQALAELPVLPSPPTPAATDLPADTPEPTPEEEIALLGGPTFSTDHFYYRGSTCGPKEITVRVEGDDPQLYSVVLFYRLQGMGGGEQTTWVPTAMNPTSSGAFTRTIAAEQDIPDFTRFDQAIFQIQIVATDSNQVEVARTGIIDGAVLERCSGR